MTRISVSGRFGKSGRVAASLRRVVGRLSDRAPVRRPAAGGPSGFRSRRPLILVATLVPIFQLLVCELLHLSATASLSIQTTAPEPYGTFVWLRFLLVFSSSFVTLAAGLGVLVVYRSLLTALMLRLAWPTQMERPSFRRTWRHAVVYTLVEILLLSPATALLYALGVVPGFWFYASALPFALVPILLTHHWVVSPCRYRSLPHVESVAWMVITAGIVMLGNLTVHQLGSFGPVAIVVCGVANAWCWYGFVHTIVLRQLAPNRVVDWSRLTHLHWPRHQLGLTAGTVSLLLLAPLGAFLAASFEGQALAGQTARPFPPGKPVLIVGGYRGALTDQMERRDATSGRPYLVRHFSYRGLDEDGRPILYAPASTDKPLGRLDRMLDRQVRYLSRRAGGRRVTLIGNSEGTLVVKSYLLRHPHAPVDQLVLLSPILSPARVYYPPGGHQGYGVAGGYELRAIAFIVSHLLFHVSADGPILRSMESTAGWMRSGEGCSLPRRFEQLDVVDLTNALASGPSIDSRMPTVIMPTWHSGIRASWVISSGLLASLQSGDIAGSSRWSVADSLIRGMASTWQVPELPLSWNRAAWPAKATSCLPG